MDRKKKEFPPSKEVNFHFRLTKELYEVLQTEATSADMTLSDYVRKLLTNRKPIIKKRIEIVFNDQDAFFFCIQGITLRNDIRHAAAAFAAVFFLYTAIIGTVCLFGTAPL